MAACMSWQHRMSPNNPPRRRFQPTEPPEPTRLTLDEFVQFKKIFEDSSLATYIKMAGWGALVAVLLEVGRMLWLAYRYYHGV